MMLISSDTHKYIGMEGGSEAPFRRGGGPNWRKAEMGNFCKAENGNLRFFEAEIATQT